MDHTTPHSVAERAAAHATIKSYAAEHNLSYPKALDWLTRVGEKPQASPSEQPAESAAERTELHGRVKAYLKTHPEVRTYTQALDALEAESVDTKCEAERNLVRWV